jgi:hypothetical protein
VDKPVINIFNPVAPGSYRDTDHFSAKASDKNGVEIGFFFVMEG